MNSFSRRNGAFLMITEDGQRRHQGGGGYGVGYRCCQRDDEVVGVKSALEGLRRELEVC